MKRLKGPSVKVPRLKGSGLKGSSLKRPDIQVPPFLADVYYDMRDRRLLPLVALVVVAIVAVPFLLSEPEQPPPAQTPAESAAEATEVVTADASQLTVVEAKPGLRDYRQRLRGRTPTDPFIQRYTGLPPGTELTTTSTTSTSEGGGEAADTTEVSVTEEEGSVTVEVDEPGSSGGGSTGGSGGSTGDGGSTGPADRPEADTDGIDFYAFRPDVRFGVAGSGQLKEYPDLSLTSLLPKQDPVVLFLGATEDGSRVVFDVSPEVVFVKGDGKCIGGRQSCGLLFMRAGEAVTLVTETPGRSFQLAVDAIELIEVDPTRSAHSSAAGEPVTPGYSAVGQFQRNR